MTPDRRRAKLNTDIAELHSSLKEAEATVLNKVQERVFVEYFLPMFAGNLEVEEANLRQSQWNVLAGTLVSEVLVTAPSGEELFRVPAMAMTRIFDVTKRDGPTIDELAAMSERIQMQSPARAEQFLSDNYTKKVLSMRDPNNKRQPEIQRWLDIFARYGVRMGRDETAASNAAGQVPSTSRLQEVGEE